MPPSVRVGGSVSTPPVVETPGPGAMTVYAVTNPNTVALTVRHILVGREGTVYVFSQQIPAMETFIYHLRDMPQVPSPFQGSLTLESNLPFRAWIVGFDYPLPGDGGPGRPLR